MNHRYLEWTLAGALLLGGGGVVAETSTTVEGYTIHHNAPTTDMLEPQIATAYGIQRSKNRGMLNGRERWVRNWKARAKIWPDCRKKWGNSPLNNMLSPIASRP